MSDLHFKFARAVVLVAAPFLALNWVFMDSELSPRESAEVGATITFTSRKQQEYIRLLTREYGEIEINCIQAPQMCGSQRPQTGTRLLVRLKNTGALGGWWLITAQRQGRSMVTADIQAAAYRQLKVIWGVGTLAAVLAAIALLYFAPFRAASNEA